MDFDFYRTTYSLIIGDPVGAGIAHRRTPSSFYNHDTKGNLSLSCAYLVKQIDPLSVPEGFYQKLAERQGCGDSFCSEIAVVLPTSDVTSSLVFISAFGVLSAPRPREPRFPRPGDPCPGCAKVVGGSRVASDLEEDLVGG